MHIVVDARNRQSSTGRYTDRLLEHLQIVDTHNHYTVLVHPEDSWKASVDSFTPLPSPYAQFSFNPLQQLGFAWQLYRLRPDLVHFTMTQQPLLYFGKIITTTHDLTMLRYTRKGRLPGVVHALRMALYRLLFWQSHKKSCAIIVPSRFVKKDLVEYQPFTRNKIHITYEAGDLAPSIKTTKPKGVTKPFIMHVGSPFPHKNIERLVEAFAILKQSNPSLKLVLAGKKEFYFEELEKKLSDNKYKNDILLPGFISDGELAWLYENAEAYVLPSLSEGFGLPGLEAMTHGCPLISSDATCLPEIYGNGAHYFNPEDINDMSSKISDVIENKTLKNRLIQNGYKRLSRYSWERMAEQTYKLYLSVSQPALANQRQGSRKLGTDINNRVTRYILVGGSAYLIEMISLIILKSLTGLSPVQLVAISFWIGLLFAFFAQKYVTFKNNSRQFQTLRKQGGVYVLLVAWNYCFTLICTHLFADIMPVIFIRTIVILIITTWNYQIYKHIFSNEQKNHKQTIQKNTSFTK